MRDVSKNSFHDVFDYVCDHVVASDRETQNYNLTSNLNRRSDLFTMIDPTLEKLESQDVDEINGLTLRMAFAIYVYDWCWHERPGDGYPHILLDEPIPADKHLNNGIAIYLGGGYHVLGSLGKYDEDLSLMLEFGKKIKNRRAYIYRLEDEIGSSDHFFLAHAGAEQRCRAILKMAVERRRREERIKAEKEKIIKEAQSHLPDESKKETRKRGSGKKSGAQTA